MRRTLHPIPQASVGFADQEGFFFRVLTKLNSLWVRATYPFAGKGRKLSLHYASEISRCLAPRIRLGHCVEIGKHTWFHLGMDGAHEVRITIEDNCRIGPRCTISAKNSIYLERDVVVAADVLVMDHGHAYQDPSKPISAQGATQGGRIRIKERCRIGQGAVVLCDKGELVLGQNCVVAEGAVVTRSFPPDSVLSGNPARVVQKSGAGRVSGPLSLPKEFYESGGLSRDSGSLATSSQEMSASRSDVKESDSEQELTTYSRQGMSEEDPLSWVSRAAGKLRTLWLAWTYPFACFAKGAWVHYSGRIARSAARYISIGKNVGLARDVRLDVSAAPETTSPVIILEAGSGMQRRCMISARNRIHVMSNVIFGPSVLVTDHLLEPQEDGLAIDRQKRTGGTIRIEEDCWIGYGAVIVCDEGELVIGRHSVVGANSVITRSIPPFSVVAGDPTRIVKQYDFFERKWVLGCVRPRAGDRQDTVPVAGGPVKSGFPELKS
jgi:acetyltransferase-like isoleucine patch superfamily enzyme